MRNRFAEAALFCVVLLALFDSTGSAADMNGPMSSGKKPEVPAGAQAPDAKPAADAKSALDVEKLFANTCGWCHSAGGRAAGKGPKLMGTTLTDAEIIHRIKVGKPGAMPAFGGDFNDQELQAIVAYIRGLKEDGKTQ